jgi:DNA-binding NarL/FixJ family response regulator
LEAIKVTRSLSPHILIADVTMPGLSGIEVIRKLHFAAPQVKVLILSMHEDRDFLKEAMRAGARGYLLKDSGPEDLLHAIERVHAGEPFVTAGKSNLLLESGSPQSSGARSSKYHPSPREGQVLSCLVDGLTSKEIARQLSLSPRTIESHRANLKRKLGIRTNAGLVKYAIVQGFGMGPRKLPDSRSAGPSPTRG